MTVGYIGLGAMGGSLARHLVAERDLVVYDLNAATLETFRALGASVAATPCDLARGSDIVVLCLPRSSDVEAILFGPAGIAGDLKPGSLVVDQTSGVPSLTTEFARRLSKRGVLFLDAPVSGGIPAAQNRAVTIMASGPDAAWALAGPVLRGMSGKVLRCGFRVGDGQALKLITNAIGACYRLATLELAALWRSFGLPLPGLVSALNAGTGANFTSRHMLAGLVEGRSTTNFAMTLMVKDLNGALDLGTATSAAMPMTATARGLMQCSIALFGANARLDDVIPLTETLSAVRLAQADPNADPIALPPGTSPGDLLTVLCGAAAACNIVSVLEGVRVGQALGLDLGGMARVVEAGSAWSDVAASLFAELGAGRFTAGAHAPAAQSLEAAAVLAARVGLPFLMPGIALSRWRSGLG